MVQLRGYQKSLQKLGHEAEYLSAPDSDLSGFDEAWLFHVNFAWCPSHYRIARSANVPVRLFPIYYSKSLGTCSPAEPGVFIYAKYIYPLSETEVFEIMCELDLPMEVHDKMRVIPNGIEKEVFYDRGLERKYVMTAGRYETYKGHLRVVGAAASLGLPCLTVGAAAGWETSVQDQCKAACGPDSLVLDNVSQEELANLYSQARVYVCASTSERNNLTILEAAACGASVINSTGNRGRGWLSAPAVDSTNQEELKAAIQQAYWNPKDYSREVKSWDAVVEEILNAG